LLVLLTCHKHFGLVTLQSTKVTIQSHYASIKTTINKNLLTALLLGLTNDKPEIDLIRE
jgi:hypothetical protein